MKKWLMAGLGAIVVISIVLAQYWSFMPDVFSVEARSLAKAKELNTTPVTGFKTTPTLIELTKNLFNKTGATPDNIKQTMRDNNMTRPEVIRELKRRAASGG